jgi:CRP-like cAMP-binding protein
MNTEVILANVSNEISLTDIEQKIFLGMLEPKIVKRKQLILQEGEICHHSTFVVSGALKGYTVDKLGGEHILNFALNDWWIADMYSLISEKPGILNIEAIVDTEIIQLSRGNQQKLYEQVPKFERFFRIRIENALVANQQRTVDNLSLSAEERYLIFIKKYPSILECVPQHNIASYLGITPEFLSKIRKRLSKNDKAVAVKSK